MKICVLTGAGISKESGVDTFRDTLDGLWNKYDITDVATTQGWKNDSKYVLEFYNEMRNILPDINPNDAHTFLCELEKYHDVSIITQNVDDLHERAGSTNVMHLHGELTQSKSTVDGNLIYNIGYNNINIGDKCEKGSQLRPNVVWFGEDVPKIKDAAKLIEECDMLIIIGTSLSVSPASELAYCKKYRTKCYYIDPDPVDNNLYNIETIKNTACDGINKLSFLLK